MAGSVRRFATFNVALCRPRAGDLIEALSGGTDPQARACAEIIQHIRPDAVLLNELDYDGDGEALELFQRRYLAIGQRDERPIHYAHVIAFPSNTGCSGVVDWNRDGIISLPDDALGYGAFPGQYGFALLSRFPVLRPNIRSFRKFLWSDMPDNRMPHEYYPPAALAAQPLSSKNHVDVPLQLADATIHVLASHPAPPAFDGVEQHNARRNFDEIRFFADYIDPGRGTYIYDDEGVIGALQPDAACVILGDLNCDPAAGNGLPGAIDQLLRHPALNPATAVGADTPASDGGREFVAGATAGAEARRGNPNHVTASFNGGLRVDYVLPSRSLRVVRSGVFWPGRTDPRARLVAADLSSDHRLVWVDLDHR